MSHTSASVTENLRRQLAPFLKEGCEVKVQVDDDGVLRSFTISTAERISRTFTVYGGDFTWEARL